MTVADAKAANRRQAAAARSRARATADADVDERIATVFLDAVPVQPDSVVAAYWPRGDEVDTRPLLAALLARGIVCALPVVERRGSPLVFRRWGPDQALAEGAFGIPEPMPAAPVVVPTVVVVPLLAFDRAGHRLGSGGGYYDRTLALLREQGKVMAVGVGYAAQEVACLPAELHDQRLDWIVTEKGAIRIAGRRRVAKGGPQRRMAGRNPNSPVHR
ncbi:MAG: 5-formyltetrahydrofolate cyclo-ligase [Alphaproteobacteria bacterium]